MGMRNYYRKHYLKNENGEMEFSEYINVNKICTGGLVITKNGIIYCSSLLQFFTLVFPYTKPKNASPLYSII